MLEPSDTRVSASVLSLQPLPRELKRAALEGGEVSLALEPGGRQVLSCWERSRALGADPDGTEALENAIFGWGDVRDACARTERVWRSARNLLEEFAGTCARRDFITLLTDSHGVVAHAVGGGAFQDEARRLRLVEGAAWTEDLRGTNAIGTSLAEARPVAVHGAAHYARVNEGVMCIAAPIRDPEGHVVAVLDATSWADRAGTLDAGVVLTVARAIEEVLRVHEYARTSGGLDLVERLIERAAGAAFLVEAPGRIVRSNAEARALLDRCRNGSLLPDWRELVALADVRGVRDFEFTEPHDPSMARIAVEPILREDGRLLALLVFITRVRHWVERVPSRASLDSDPPRAQRHEVPGDLPTPERAFAAIVGEDPALRSARKACARLAPSNLPVLLLGETGSGKELFARAIHDASSRASGPYLAINCGAIQPELLLSELFGHAPSAFTGASRTGRDGIVAAAHGGSLFLDEVADLSAESQVALLRVLEDGSYTRVGEAQPRRADIRIIAATSRDLRERVASGRFREDLYFRISGACVELPPLRERTDFFVILDFLWSRMRLPTGAAPASLSRAARACLAGYAWPGNVRELKSSLEYAAVLAADARVVDVEHLPAPIREARGSADDSARLAYAGPGENRVGALEDARRRSLECALRDSPGNISEAARRLGVARSTVYRLMRRYGLGAS